ncbi:type VI secretion system baseplate subunit TssK [Serratia microhaemolytica]|uniref:type VI secretion system baseplate subunit TssK n=1 Tax=Serratia microhaemolytica TaxID=2675110 RepID=UPI000FDDCA8F|nr:type VI secretion system baseplate subunit TssK [Serratia microhaemolytica]
MRIERPLWTRGIMVSPQQFQQQAALEAWTNQCIAEMALLYPWGVLQATFSAQALALGRLQAECLRVRFADGVLIDTDHADPLPPTLTLAEHLPLESSETTVMLALPLLYANGNNCLPINGAASRPVRYRQAWSEVQNHYSDDKKPIAVMQYHLTLRLSQQQNSDYQLCPVARLVRNAKGQWVQDSEFIPPLLSLNASRWCNEQLELLLVQLRARARHLMTLRRENNHRMADFAVADVSLFWLLNALNSAEPILSSFQRNPQLPPERLYLELARLAGSLLTFSLEYDVSAIPDYQHDNLTAVFPPLFGLLNTLLEVSMPSRVVAIELQHEPRVNQWRATLHDPRLRAGVDLYLSVRSSLPATQLQTLLPQLCKIGAPDQISNVVNVAISGVPLQPLSHVPAAIPMRLGNHYFSLDVNHPAAKQMLEVGACTLYVPGTLGEIQLELFAVLPS